MPKEARWSFLQANAKQPAIGKLVDDAMVAIERDNSRLKGVLPKDYARPGLDKHRLGELIDLIGTIALVQCQRRGRRLPRPNSPPTPVERQGRGQAGDAAAAFAPLRGPAGPGLRILPDPVRQRRGQERRAVLHAIAASSACWSKCSRRTRAASTIPAAAPGACSCRARNSWRPTAASWATSASTGRRATPRPGGWPS